MESQTRLLACARRHPFFAGLSDADFSAAQTLLCARVAQYKKNEYLRTAGDPFPCFGLVLFGSVQVYMEDMDGHPLMMATVSAGETFGESLAYLGTDESPVSIFAFADSAVLWLDAAALRRALMEGLPLARSLSERLTRVLAVRTLSQNDRIQVLSKQRIRDRIITFLSQCEHRYGSRTFTLPLDREGLAVYLGVNRSALSRELSLMKKEGILDYFRGTFRLLP